MIRGFATLLPTECEVIRDGIEQKLQPANIVLGDIVVVRSGAKVPADLRLIVSCPRFGVIPRRKRQM